MMWHLERGGRRDETEREKEREGERREKKGKDRKRRERLTMTDWNTKRRKDGRRISELRAERNEM